MENTPRTWIAPTLAVFLVSLGVLVMEISLTRLLSFSLWYHFTYAVIAVVLLGYGASGAILASSRRLSEMEPSRLLHAACLVGSLGVALALLAIGFLPFRPFQIATDPTQILLMVLYLLVIALPFVAAGLVVAAALRHWREHTTLIYFADLSGAGTGCALAVPAMWGLGTPGAIAFGAALLALAACIMAGRRGRLRSAALAAASILAVAAIAGTVEFRPSSDKFFASLLEKGLEPLYSRWSPIFRVDVYQLAVEEGRRGGMSKRFEGRIPPVRLIAHDGGAEAGIYRFDGDPSELEFIRWNVVSAPYQVLDRPNVLIIGLGGGFDVLAAISGDAQSITGVELDPVTIDAVRNHSGAFGGHILDRPEVSTVVAEGRSFLRRQQRQWDLIQLTGVDTLTALSTGAYVLAESYLYTVESMKDYLARLSPNGILSFMVSDVNFGYQQPPRFSLRNVANFYRAAKELGYADPAAHVVVMASAEGVPQVEIMFKKSPFLRSELSELARFANEREFRIWAMPGPGRRGPLNVILNGSPQEREHFFRSYPLDVRETRDDRPFFFHFFRWLDLFHVTRTELDRGHTGATGQIVLLALLAFAIVASIALILLPLAVSQRIVMAAPDALRLATYFGALGLGFMLFEISLIQRFILFLGHPTYSIATIQASLLVSAGVGSFLSGRIPVHPWRLLLPAVLGLVGLGIGYVILLPEIFAALLGGSLALRVAVAIALLIPPGLLLGVFFPSGLRLVSQRHPDFVAWAWGVNGGASVVGSILAIVLAMTYGFPAVTILGLAVYVVGVLTLLSIGSLRPAAAE